MMKKRDVAVLILHFDGKILLQKRAGTAIRFAGKWGLFGGGIEDDESPIEGLRREIMEELSIELYGLKQLCRTKYQLPEHNEIGTIFAYLSEYSNQELILNEGDEMRWVDVADSLNYDLTMDYSKVIKKYLTTL